MSAIEPQGFSASPNETRVAVELPVVAPIITVQGVILREFVWLLRPLSDESGAADGVELLCTAHDSDLTVSLRFDRGEFVSVATEGLRILDAADAATDADEGR